MSTFLELSQLLTGIPKLDSDLAASYQQTLEQKYGAAFFHELYEAYARARNAKDPLETFTEIIGRDTSDRMRTAAKQIVKIWYFSQYNDPETARLANAGYFQRGLAWPLLEAYPHSYSPGPHGYWTERPRAH
jgi:phage tail tape-measure protein